jgi:hypothetical protein
MSARPLAALLLPLALLGARPARACKFAPLQPHTSDKARQATDKQPPRFTSPPILTVTRGNYSVDSPWLGCGGEKSSGDCSDDGTIRIAVPVSDDQTPAEECGFFLTLVKGTLNEGLELPPTAVRAINGEIFLHLPRDNDLIPLDFVLAVSPVDAAGNEGEQVQLPISSGGGCSIVPGARPGTWLLVLLLAFWGGLRRLSHGAAAAPATRRRGARSG